MRRLLIFGLIGMLAVLFLLDVYDASHQPGQPTVPAYYPAAPPLATVTPLPGVVALAEIPAGTVDAVMVTLTAMEQAAPSQGTAIPSTAMNTINNLPYDRFIILPPETQQHIREIYTLGLALGNYPRVFTRLGDSTIEYPYFLARFDEGDYNLGAYAYLQGVIDYYAGAFAHQSLAVRRGLHTWSVLDPMWAGSPCQPGEHMLACELRTTRASLLFIRLGSNDAGVPDSTERHLREIIEYVIAQGVIPVMGTKADRHEGSNINNEIIRQLALEYRIPLMDYDLVSQTLPGRGLAADGVHMTTFYAHDYSQALAFQRGHSVHNLVALVMLDQIWRVLGV